MRSLLALALVLLPAAAGAQAPSGDAFSHVERLRATFLDSVAVQAIGRLDAVRDPRSARQRPAAVQRPF